MFPLSAYRIMFRPTVWPTVAALVALALTLHLGIWQQERAEEKRGLQQLLDKRMQDEPLRLRARMQLEPNDEFRRAVMAGRYLAEEQFFLDNKSNGTDVGYHVVTPFVATEGGAVLLVNRGFVSRSSSYPRPPAVPVPAGEVEIHGMLKRPTSKFLELGNALPSADRVWQNLTIERYAEYSRKEVQPLLLLLADSPSPLVNVLERPDARVSKHVEYMLTWYSLAATVVVLWFALNIRFVPKKQP